MPKALFRSTARHRSKFEIAWESLMTLCSNVVPAAGHAPALAPAVRTEGLAQARAALTREVERVRAERAAWVEKAFEQLDQVEYRYLDELDELPADVRGERRKSFEELKALRRRQLEDIGKVTGTPLRLAGWAQVTAGARTTELGYDPDSETVAIATVSRRAGAVRLRRRRSADCRGRLRLVRPSPPDR
ncbi:hypothetical protein AB0M80_42350 [Amycolatopsis sp. NPDC051045]|uniref:hypothetical protein n=1 Tax=Amycolatopsis sp. NPDC051045 TaxID=3156922 RepID=UPI00344AE6F6